MSGGILTCPVLSEHPLVSTVNVHNDQGSFRKGVVHKGRLQRGGLGSTTLPRMPINNYGVCIEPTRFHFPNNTSTQAGRSTLAL